MLTAAQAKAIARTLGADLCGIASIDRFDYAFGDDPATKTWRISCHRCRDICPYNLGSENRLIASPNR